jgi:TatD DNase family protein
MQEAWSGLVDAHCHLCDVKILPVLDKEVADAIAAGTTGFISSALTREEFEWVELTRFHTYHKYFRWSAGIHPNYRNSSEQDLDNLISLCKQKKIVALGEIGLDGRYYNDAWQKEILLKQLDIARYYELPVIFHIVHKFYDLYKILDKNFPRIKGYVHSFNNSLEVAEHFSSFDLGFSLGGRPPKPNVIKFLVKHGYILFETDAPYQKAKGDKAEINHLKNLQNVVKNISDISGVSLDKLIQMQKRSLNRIFPDH